MTKRLLISCVVLAGAWSAFADLVSVSPAKDETVEILPAAQRQVMALPTLAERLSFFKADRENGKKIRHDPYWRRAQPLVLRWRATGGENGLWKIRLATKPDFSDARIFFLNDKKTNAATGRLEGDGNGGSEHTYTVPMANLQVATKYYWKVSTHKPEYTSVVSSFVTSGQAPRWIEIEGRTKNIRDIGGWIGMDGRRVRQGLVYRGQGLNDNSPDGHVKGRNRLTVEDVAYLTETLGIKTDFDLRSEGEVAGMKGVSPLGPSVAYINRSTYNYRGIFTPNGKWVMAQNFRVFCDEKNYPIYFHCIGGADRTGSLAYVMNGILGVSRHDLETDWESTFYPKIPDENPDPDYWCRESHFNDGFSKYGAEGDSWNRRIELYLLDCGVTAEEIEKFRSIMLQ